MQYRLEQIVSPRSAIYRQIYQYYNYCERVRNMSQASLTSKIYVINNFYLLQTCPICAKSPIK